MAKDNTMGWVLGIGAAVGLWYWWTHRTPTTATTTVVPGTAVQTPSIGMPETMQLVQSPSGIALNQQRLVELEARQKQ